MSRSIVWTRRRFLQTAAAVTAAPTIISARALGGEGAVAPSERITVACIGLGGQGMANLHAFLGQRDAQVVALCDVDERHLTQAVQYVKNRLGAERFIVDSRRLVR